MIWGWIGLIVVVLVVLAFVGTALWIGVEIERSERER